MNLFQGFSTLKKHQNPLKCSLKQSGGRRCLCTRCSGSGAVGWSPAPCICISRALLVLPFSAVSSLSLHTQLYHGKHVWDRERYHPSVGREKFPFTILSLGLTFTTLVTTFVLKALMRHKVERWGNTLDFLTSITMKIDMN